MFEVVIKKQHYEFWDEKKEEFIVVDIPETKLQIEHSLISLKKWEQKWHKPFLKEDEKTQEEILDYIRCMTINNNVDPEIYKWLPPDIINCILEYIHDPMTATWFSNEKTVGMQKNSREIITAEIIYYWMIALNIPVEFQKWHLNQLLTLIKVVSIKNQKEQKKDRATAAKERAALNAARRAKYRSKG